MIGTQAPAVLGRARGAIVVEPFEPPNLTRLYSVYDGLITNNAWTQMLLDDDGEAERMFQEDPSVGAGPGGFRKPPFPPSRRVI